MPDSSEIQPSQPGVPGQAPAHDPPRHHLQLLVRPGLDRPVGREELRIGPGRLERAGDRARALDAAAVELERRHRAAAEADEPEVHPLRAGQHRRELVPDALELEHPPDGVGGMRQREPVEPGGDAADPTCGARPEA
jgi:hypothetical protein